MLSWGFATEGVCVRGGFMFRKQIKNRVNGAEINKRVSNRATVMRKGAPMIFATPMCVMRRPLEPIGR